MFRRDIFEVTAESHPCHELLRDDSTPLSLGSARKLRSAVKPAVLSGVATSWLACILVGLCLLGLLASRAPLGGSRAMPRQFHVRSIHVGDNRTHDQLDREHDAEIAFAA